MERLDRNLGRVTLEHGKAHCEEVLWAVVEFTNCDRVEYSVHISAQQIGEILVGSSTWLGGSGKQSFQVDALQPDKDGYFGGGNYRTSVRTSVQGDIAFYDWEVVTYPPCGGAQLPATSFGFERPDAELSRWVAPDGDDDAADEVSPIEAEAQTADTPPQALFGFGRGR